MNAAERTRLQAEIDQFRAGAEDYLNVTIAECRTILSSGSNSDYDAYTAMVRTVLNLVDPRRELPEDRSESLTKMAELFSCAVLRLAKIPQVIDR